jgi:hypothetical protein
MTEFMVRVLHSRSALLRFTMFAGVETNFL